MQPFVDNVETIKTMLTSGLGVAIVPSVSVRNEVRLKQLATRWIRSVPDASIVLINGTQPKNFFDRASARYSQ